MRPPNSDTTPCEYGAPTSDVPLFLDPEASDDLNTLAESLYLVTAIMRSLSTSQRLDTQTQRELAAYCGVLRATARRVEGINHRNGMCIGASIADLKKESERETSDHA